MTSRFYGEPTPEEVERLRQEVARAREQVRINDETIRNLSLLCTSRSASTSVPPPPPPGPPPQPRMIFPFAPPKVFFPPAAPAATSSGIRPQVTSAPISRPPNPTYPAPTHTPAEPKTRKGGVSVIELRRSSLDPFLVDLRTPENFGEFSCRDGCTLLAHNQAQRFLKKPLPAFPINVCDGLDQFSFVQEKNERYELLLKWICEHAEIDETLLETVNQSDFVCLRGTILRFADASTNERPFCIAATKINGVIFLFEHSWYHTPSKKKSTYIKLKAIEAISEYGGSTMDHELGDEYFAVLTADFVPEQTSKTSPPLRVLYAAKVDMIDPATDERLSFKTYGYTAYNELQAALMAPSAVMLGTVNSKDGYLMGCEKLLISGRTSIKEPTRWIYKILSEIKKQMDAVPGGNLWMIEKKQGDDITISRCYDQSRWFMTKTFLQRFSQQGEECFI